MIQGHLSIKREYSKTQEGKYKNEIEKKTSFKQVQAAKIWMTLKQNTKGQILHGNFKSLTTTILILL